MSYTVHHREHGIIIEGPVPVSDLTGVVKIGKENGYDLLDASISVAIPNATMVLTNKESGDAWRKELGIG